MLNVLLLFLPAVVVVDGEMDSRYSKNREQILLNEKQQFFGSEINLSDNERTMDLYIKSLKELEYHNFEEDKFLPAQDFLRVREKISNSSLYKFLKVMPKGASLHTHILVATDVNFIVRDISYMEDLYMYYFDGRLKLKFMNASSAELLRTDFTFTDFKKVSEARRENIGFDDWLESQLTITSKETSKTSRWDKLSRIISTVFDMLTYRPAFEKYLWQALKELVDDKIIYTEFRGTFMELYDLNGQVYDFMETLKVMTGIISKFEIENANEFIGAKYIYAPFRKQDNITFHEHMKMLKLAHLKYPSFIVGFDMVGMEDAGGFLKSHINDIRKLHTNINLYFHAGETNWYGTDTDLNLLDAILLGSKRIGHALSLIKHPELLKIVKERRIAIEVTPVSNQVLLYVRDLRNHPAAAYAAYGIPIVICNDDPMAFGNSGLSYDYYLALMAFSNLDSGLLYLKTMALNSIGFSSLHSNERQRAFNMFEKQWDHYTLALNAFKVIMTKLFKLH